MTLTFDLWPCKPLQQWPLTWAIFLPSFIKIPPPSTEISCHAKQVLTDGRPLLDGIPENIVSLVGGINMVAGKWGKTINVSDNVISQAQKRMQSWNAVSYYHPWIRRRSVFSRSCLRACLSVSELKVQDWTMTNEVIKMLTLNDALKCCTVYRQLRAQ